MDTPIKPIPNDRDGGAAERYEGHPPTTQPTHPSATIPIPPASATDRVLKSSERNSGQLRTIHPELSSPATPATTQPAHRPFPDLTRSMMDGETDEAYKDQWMGNDQVDPSLLLHNYRPLMVHPHQSHSQHPPVHRPKSPFLGSSHPSNHNHNHNHSHSHSHKHNYNHNHLPYHPSTPAPTPHHPHHHPNYLRSPSHHLYSSSTRYRHNPIQTLRPLIHDPAYHPSRNPKIKNPSTGKESLYRHQTQQQRQHDSHHRSCHPTPSNQEPHHSSCSVQESPSSLRDDDHEKEDEEGGDLKISKDDSNLKDNNSALDPVISIHTDLDERRQGVALLNMGYKR